MASIDQFLRLVLDPVRLAVIGQAALGPVDVDEISARLAVPRREVLEAMGRLRAARLLSDHGLDREVLTDIAASLPRDVPADPELVGEQWNPDEAEILSRFFSGTRLSSIPTQRAKRLIVLERLAQEFDPGVRYPEKQVNFMLQLFHADYAALRRYLVDEGLLTRADGVYWRTGGRFDPAPDDVIERDA